MSNEDDTIEGEFQLTSRDSVSATQAISTAEFDMQIATAKKYPRSVAMFAKNATSLVSLNQEIASSCMYSLPRGKKSITGPSVRFAEIVLATWKNARGAARIVEEGENFITAQGIFHDLESNTGIAVEVRRRITDKDGNRYNDDMIMVAANAACSIALRNAILRGVPKAFWQDAFEASKITAIGKGMTLQQQRDQMLDAFGKMTVKEDEIYAYLEVVGYEDLTPDHLAHMRGVFQGIKEGEYTVDKVFRVAPSEASGKTVSPSALNEKLKDRTQKLPAEPAQDKKPATKKTPEVPTHVGPVPGESEPETTKQPASAEASAMDKFRDMLAKAKTAADCTKIREAFTGKGSKYNLTSDDADIVTQETNRRAMEIEFEAESAGK